MAPTVLIGFADALAAPEAVFSLRAAGFGVRVFARAGTRPLVARRLPVGAPIEIPPPEADAAAAVDALRAAVAADRGIEVVMALDDAALWLTDAAFGAGQAARERPHLAGAWGDRAALGLDKTRQIALAREAGLAAPPTLTLEGPSDAARIDRFPCIVKSARAGQLVDGRLLRGGAVWLADAAARDAARFGGVLFPALAQPLIRGTGEGLFGFVTQTGATCWSAHRRVRMMNPHGSGASACRAIPVDPALRAAGARMIAAADWRGPFMIELLRDEAGRAHFMELNGRLWGSTALARRAGFEYPAWAAAQALDPGFAPPPAPPFREVAVRHLGRDLAHVAFVLRGPRTAFHRAGWPSAARAALAALTPAPGRGFYNHDPRHPWYFLADALDTLAAQLRGRRS